MFRNFMKGFLIAIGVMIVLSLCWWVIKLIIDVTAAAFGFIVGVFAPWVLVLIIAIIFGLWYMNKHKEDVVIIEK